MPKDTLQMTAEPTSDINAKTQEPLHTMSYQPRPSLATPPPPADCMPCKLVGCAGFGGLGLYSFYQAQQLPKNLVARRLGLGAMGTAFIGAAVYRLTMPMPPQQPASEQ
ncbi:hypothetical protein BGZ97_009238 [Linnemannia gamsii]|uniref:Distal membrane-arm assembly complex protein 1-like domain-containing protein n=1 Tax=Linnemannia gamsii TaxID=64522 RepID=A0A9P6UNW7_9FUNG|nr:hypothetical protein BGZ97_009238 [Linnemannia gamsii]